MADRRGAVAADDLVRAFRFALVAASLVHLAVFREPAAAVYAVALTAVNALDVLPARFRPVARHVQLAADLALTVWLIGWGAPAAGAGTTLWVLLLLPIVEAAVHRQLAGALVTWALGEVALHVLTQPTGPDQLAEQATVFAVAVAVGLLSEVTEHRLRALARARRETDRRASLLTAVASAARTVTALEPRKVIDAVADAALELGFDMVEICILSDDRRSLAPVVQRGWPPHHPPTSQPADSGVAGRAVVRGRTVVVEDYQTWEHALPVHRDTGIARSAASSPIRVGDEVVAVLTVANHVARRLTDYERDCLELLATQAGVALQHAEAFAEGRRQQEELARRATTDPLTGVANRAHFLELLDARLDPLVRERGPVTLLFLDLDDFKRVNDTLGHQAGDEVLCAVSRRLRTAVRPADTVARYGGDEFVVLVDDAPQDTDAIAERVLSAVSAPLEVAGEVVVPRASLGVATERPGDDPEALLARADERMYRAKAADTGYATDPPR